MVTKKELEEHVEDLQRQVETAWGVAEAHVVALEYYQRKVCVRLSQWFGRIFSALGLKKRV